MHMTFKGWAAIVLTIAAAGAAHAGGFSRGTANTDILYEDGRVVLQGGSTYVAPSRAYETVSGRPVSDGSMTGSYWVPGLAVKIGINDASSCALTYTEPYGASLETGAQTQRAQLLAGRDGSIASHLRSDEYGATCAVKLPAGPGNLVLVGGVFLQSIDYNDQSLLGTLHLGDDEAYGYRLGAAYEIPDYALRAQLLYRSAVDHEGDGTFTASPLAAARYGVPAGYTVFAHGGGTLPQSLEISLRSGIAKDWLAFGSVKWTDWSVLPSLDYVVTGFGPQHRDFNFRDGWTIQGGLAHSFTEKLAGLVSVTWDRGVSTGADVLTDTWTLGAGAQLKTDIGNFQIGTGLSYMTAGMQSIARGATLDATVGGDWGLGVTTSYAIKF